MWMLGLRKNQVASALKTLVERETQVIIRKSDEVDTRPCRKPQNFRIQGK